MVTTMAEQLLASVHGLAFIEGTLVDKDTYEPFQFNKFDSRAENLSRYEEICQLVCEIVYNLLEQQGLQRIHCPVVDREDDTFFFMSADALNNPNKLMVIIHGSGAVRAGQWSRKIIINERNGLEKGTQLPYIRKAQKLGYGIIVMNTNFHVDSQRDHYEFSKSPEGHACYIWKNYVLLSAARKVVVVAHSYGGQVTSVLAQNNKEYFQRHVRAVAFSDAVSFLTSSRFEAAFFNARSRNWVISHLPVGTPIGIRSVSAGENRHEYTPCSSMEDAFKFIENKMQLPSDEVDKMTIEEESQLFSCRCYYILACCIAIVILLALLIIGYFILHKYDVI